MLPHGVRAAIGVAILLVSQVTSASAKMRVDFPLTKSVGPLQAGQFCLPKSSLRGSDFVSDEYQFDLLVRQTLDEQAMHNKGSLGSGSTPKIEVHLKSAAVKLCAKSWGMFGMGDTKSLSGKAAFTFTWKKDGQKALAVETIALEVNGKERLTAPAILRRAINVLCGRIAASGQ